MKKYKYNDKVYCKEDLSEEIDNYGGDLWDLYNELEKDKKVSSHKLFYPADCECSSQYYDNRYDLIENEYDCLDVECYE